MNKLVFMSETLDPVAEALSKLHDTEAFADEAQFDKSKVAGFVIDCKVKTFKAHATDREIFDKSLTAGIPVVLLNVSDAYYMASLCGIGVETQGAIVSVYKGKKIIHVLDPETKEAHPLEVSRTVTQEADGKIHLDSPVQHPDSDVDLNALPSITPSAELSPDAQAEVIEAGLIFDDRYEDIDARMELGASSFLGALPAHQVYGPLYFPIKMSPSLPCGQVGTADVIMEITLIASHNNPPYKYLRITSLGAGFHPGTMCYNGNYGRGWFQARIPINMGPISGPIETLQSSPKNMNNQTSYTTSSSFTVGVDVNKDPGFNASYTIEESETREVADFDIKNDSAGLLGRWIWQLGMTKNSIWDIFKQPFGKKAQVKLLPNLATSNLQPACTTVWYTNKDYQGFVPMGLWQHVDYFYCSVTGNWAKYKMWCQGKGFGKGYSEKRPVVIDFSRVNA